jgi:DNA mismatch repair protein MutS
VPGDYIRRQTLVNAERFIIPELKEYEEKILGAEERSCRIELELFENIRSNVMRRAREIQEVAEAIAALDILSTFAHLAHQYKYVRPSIDEGEGIAITAGRHPVVEQVLEEGRFVENDTDLNCDDQHLLIITGPNMAGKSTYLRQVALIVLMAQVGSFVPAESARIGVVDRIFTRIGASDNLARGESTFMVEMIETAYILNNVTPRSLIVLDEIGRGTSTYDGVSIAWAVCEHLGRADGPRPKTLFATHYHELTDLEQEIAGARNYTVMVKEHEDDVVFIRKITPGSADRSYGIHVGKLAGLPENVVARAQRILNDLEDGLGSGGPAVRKRARREERELTTPPVIPFSGKSRPQTIADPHRELPLSHGLQEEHPLIDEIKGIDIHNLTPLEALNRLNQLREKARACAEEEKEVQRY